MSKMGAHVLEMQTSRDEEVLKYARSVRHRDKPRLEPYLASWPIHGDRRVDSVLQRRRAREDAWSSFLHEADRA